MNTKKDDLVSAVSTTGDESPRRETAVDDEDAEESMEPANEELSETMELDGDTRPEPTDEPRDISPWGRRNPSEIGLSLKTDKELMADYEEKAAEDRKRAV